MTKFVWTTVEDVEIIEENIDAIEGIEIIKESIIDGKRTLEELKVDGILCVRTDENKYELRMDGWTWPVDARGRELGNLLKEEVKDFLDVYGDCVKVPDDNLHKYLTLGDLREMLKDLPDDTLIAGTENDLIQCIKVGYITEKVKTFHDLAGGFDYQTRKFFMKDVDAVGGWVNAEDYRYPESEEDLLKTVSGTKESVKNFAKTYNKDERVGVKLW